MLSDKDQLDWHKDGKQGCMFAKLLSNKWDPIFWKRCVLQNDDSLVSEIKKEVDLCSQNPGNQILSIIVPEILTVSDLVDFIKQLKRNYPNIYFDSDNSTVEEHTLVSIRLPAFPEIDKSFWVLAFGNFEFFPKTRQSPLFEIVLPTKSKEYLFSFYKRYSCFQPTIHSVNRGGNLSSSHLADIEIPNITSNYKKDNKLWEGTKNLKRAILDELYTDLRSKAKNSFTLKGTYFF